MKALAEINTMHSIAPLQSHFLKIWQHFCSTCWNVPNDSSVMFRWRLEGCLNILWICFDGVHEVPSIFYDNRSRFNCLWTTVNPTLCFMNFCQISTFNYMSWEIYMFYFFFIRVRVRERLSATPGHVIGQGLAPGGERGLKPCWEPEFLF